MEAEKKTVYNLAKRPTVPK